MTNVTVDRPLAAELAGTDGLVEVRDPDGMVVGYFAPLNVEHAVHYAEAAAKSTAYRTRAMSDTSGRKTTAEVLEHLQTLG